MIELFKIYLDEDYNLILNCSSHMLIIVCTLTLILVLYLFHKNKIKITNIDISEAELGIGSQKIKLTPNHQTIQVAYKLWVELNTRKLGLPIDEENDVIVEIYDSWYKFFEIARNLIKEIPAHKASDENTKKLILISSKILNEAIRPHLTIWQARFREWYKRRIEMLKDNTFSPQDVQKKYNCENSPFCYELLMKDMKKVNKRIIYYKKILEQIVFGKEI